MTTKLVCRLLDAAGALLGWCDVQAVARGDGALWSPGPVAVPVDVSGQAAWLSTHWCDVNIETRVPCPVQCVAGGEVVVASTAAPLIRVGPAAGGLPPVTLRRRLTVTVPVGAVGAETRGVLA